MQSFVLIFLSLLSFIFDGCGAGFVCDRSFHCTDAVVRCSDTEASDKKADYDDVAILPVRTAAFSSNGSGSAPSVRPTNSGRRVQPSTKFSFRVIKAGKVLDRNNFHTFRAVLLQFQSGIRSNSRYIHSICQLLI